MAVHRFRSDESLTDEPLRDPGNGGALPVGRTGTLGLVTLAAETRTLAKPTFLSQELNICLKTDGGDCVITASVGIDASAHTSITLNDAGDNVLLIGSYGTDGTLAWRLVVNNGCTIA